MAPKKSMKARILDYVAETPRSAIEIYDAMCADGFTYGGKTPQYTTQSMLGTHYKNGQISRQMEEDGVVCGRKLQNIGCGPGCNGTYYYYIKPDPNASLTVSVELRAIFANLGPKTFTKQAKALMAEAKSAAKLIKMRKKVKKTAKAALAAQKALEGKLEKMRKKAEATSKAALAAQKALEAAESNMVTKVPQKTQRRSPRFIG